MLPREPVSSYLAFSLTSYSEAVYFLWHFPWGYPHRALPGILPCGVRTFLPRFRAGDRLAPPDIAVFIYNPREKSRDSTCSRKSLKYDFSIVGFSDFVSFSFKKHIMPQKHSVALALLFLFSLGVSSGFAESLPDPASSNFRLFSAPPPASDMILQDLRGRPVSLSGLRGKLSSLIFGKSTALHVPRKNRSWNEFTENIPEKGWRSWR